MGGWETAAIAQSLREVATAGRTWTGGEAYTRGVDGRRFDPAIGTIGVMLGGSRALYAQNALTELLEVHEVGSAQTPARYVALITI